MTTKADLHQLVDELADAQLHFAKEALLRILHGEALIPICDVGSPDDVATLYKTVVLKDTEEN